MLYRKRIIFDTQQYQQMSVKDEQRSKPGHFSSTTTNFKAFYF